MTDFVKIKLTADIQASFGIRAQNIWNLFWKRRGNKAAFFFVLSGWLLAAFILDRLNLRAGAIVISILYIIAIPLGFFLCYTHIAEGLEFESLASKYGVTEQEVETLAGQVLNG